MKKRLVAASADPNGLISFGPQVTNDLNSQIPNWASDPRQPLHPSVVSHMSANMPTSSKSEHMPSNGDENQNSPGFASQAINNQSQFTSPKKVDIAGQASFNTNQLIEAFLHNSQLAARSISTQQNDFAQILLEMMKNQLPPQQQHQQLVPPSQPQVLSRPIPSRTTPDKLLITSRSPPLRPPSETLRGFVDGTHSKPRNSYAHSPAIQSPPPSLAPPIPPIQSFSTSASARSQPSRPLAASDYNSAASVFYNQLLCMISQQQQQQQQHHQIRGHQQLSQSQAVFSPHSDEDKNPSLVGYSKVGVPSNPRNPAKYDPYVSQIRPPSHDPFTRTAPSYYCPWPSLSTKAESCSTTGGSSYSTIDILRESKQASESVKPTNKVLTTSGVFYPEKQPAAPPPPPSVPVATIKNQSDAVDHHFRISLSSNRSGVGIPSNPGFNPESGPPPLVDLTLEKKTSSKNPHGLNHSNHVSGVGLGVSSCSSSSSISSMSVFDRDAGSPSRKPSFISPPPKTEVRINSEACTLSLKKRLIQRYQADATTEQAAESLKQEGLPNSPANTLIKQEVQVKMEASSPFNNPAFGDPTKVEDEHKLPDCHELPGSTVNSHSDVNGSIPDGALKESPKRVANSTARRHPPIRASKIAPLMCSLSVSSLSPTCSLSPAKRSRGNGTKQHSGLLSTRRRAAPAGGTEFTSSKASRGKTIKPKFYNSRVASPAATSDTDVHGGRRNRTTSIRSATGQAHSEFDFNGQDDDEEPTIPMVTSKSTNRRWFGSRKRKSTAPASEPLLRVKVPRRSMEEDEVSGAKWHRHPRRNQTSNRQSRNADKNDKTTAFTDEDDDLEGCVGEGFNDGGLETTQAEHDEYQEPDEAGDEEGSVTCRRCGQLVKALKIGCSTDNFDYQCFCEDKISIQEIEKRLPLPPNLAILSHRSLCGGELGFQDTDDASSESEFPFLQLNSCTELEKLKSSSRCRACREASRVSSTTTVETNSSSGVIHSSSNNLADKNGSRRRGSGNRNHLSSNPTSLDHSESGGDSKIGAATVSVFCRFWGFRKLYYDQKGMLNVSDFCRTSEADSVDRSLWAMHRHVSPPLSRHNAIYCLDRLGAIACRLILSELSILSSSVSTGGTVIRQCCPPSTEKTSSNSPSCHVAWKRPVQGVREMCDVCETTMFNSHWVCTKCGYSVCSACYYAKANALPSTKSAKDGLDPLGDATSSVTSTTHGSIVEEEGVKNLSSAVIELGYEDYSVRQPWSTCSASRRPHDPSKMMLTALLPYGSLHCLWHRLHRIFPRLDCSCGSANRSSESHKHPQHDHHHHPISSMGGNHSPTSSTDTSAATSLDLLADLALKSTTSSGGSLEDGVNVGIEMMDGSEYRELSQEAGASGVLFLKDGDSANLKAFQRHWATNQPVSISGCGRHFNSSLWTAKSLSREKSCAGASQITLIDCETNLIVPRHPIRAFWEAFESHPSSTKRSSSSKESSRPAQHLKIREWPPMGDLSEVFPDRYADFTEHLPLPEYTHREGQLNLAARLPSFFVKPDLGPRLHIAHDLTSQPKIGTTNLRLDVADVINVLMHATRSVSHVPPKGSETQLRAFLRSAGVDLADVFQAKGHTNAASNRGLPGAVWHIFRPCDTAGLREYLIKIDKLSSSPSSGSGGDVIHDQRMFLSQDQLEELKVETGIKPYTVLQFPGDAILIPAGSVHQVRNLGNCISVSSDFISPEHISQCLELTEEFRRLPRNHPSHEDKLQVKNMIYHTVKDALSTVLKTSVANQHQQQNLDSPSLM